MSLIIIRCYQVGAVQIKTSPAALETACSAVIPGILHILELSSFNMNSEQSVVELRCRVNRNSHRYLIAQVIIRTF